MEVGARSGERVEETDDDEDEEEGDDKSEDDENEDDEDEGGDNEEDDEDEDANVCASISMRCSADRRRPALPLRRVALLRRRLPLACCCSCSVVVSV